MRLKLRAALYGLRGLAVAAALLALAVGLAWWMSPPRRVVQSDVLELRAKPGFQGLLLLTVAYPERHAPRICLPRASAPTTRDTAPDPGVRASGTPGGPPELDCGAQPAAVDERLTVCGDEGVACCS